MTFLSRVRVRPRLAIFDLDETLWPWGVDDFYFRPPYKRMNGRVVDARGQRMDPFPDVVDILSQFHENGITMAAASRTTYPDGAFSLLKLFGWNKYLPLQEIYPGCKVAHFKSLTSRTAIPYEDMIFFDNETRNIVDISQLGVTCVLVDSIVGLTWKDVEKGFKEFAEKKEKREKKVKSVP